MGNRYNELRSQGNTGIAAADIVNQELETNIPYGTLRTYGSQAKKQIVPGEHNKYLQETIPVIPKPEQTASDELEIRIKAIARQVFQEMMATVPTVTNPVYEADMPPAPEISGRHGKKDREYFKVSLTIDKSLWNRFIQERDSLRLSSGRLMDKILWEYYGRPALSYGSKDHPNNLIP
jgi:hypothetical protein